MHETASLATLDLIRIFSLQVLTGTSRTERGEDQDAEVEVLVKLVEAPVGQNDKSEAVSLGGRRLLDQQTLLISEDEAVFNFGPIKSEAQRLVIEVFERARSAR